MENFISHEATTLDLSKISSALIIGKIANNELESNGAGKSTIFKAIEFCIFNECSKVSKLEKILRNGFDKCRVVFDFEIDNKIYRVSRSRTRKGVSDLTLLERTSLDGDAHRLFDDESEFKKYWTDISGRRAQDTEATLEIIHKLNHKSFCSAYYFSQDDHNSLATATKTARKNILKESLQLSVYNNLYKLAQTRASLMAKELDKKNAILSSLGSPNEFIAKFNDNLLECKKNIANSQNNLDVANKQSLIETETLANLQSRLKSLLEQVNSVLVRQKDLIAKIKKTEVELENSSSKRKLVISQAKTIKAEIEELNQKKIILEKIDFDSLKDFKSQLEDSKANYSENMALIKSLEESLEELRIPMPEDGFCKHCRQKLSAEHRANCEKSTKEEIDVKETKVIVLKESNKRLVASAKRLSEDINKLEASKKELEKTVTSLEAKSKEMKDKEVLYREYDSITTSYKNELLSLNQDLEAINKEVEASSSEEMKDLKEKIAKSELLKQATKNVIDKLTKEHTVFTSDLAVLEHSIEQKKLEIIKKEDLTKEIKRLDEEYSVMPDLLEAFGPTGIPNLIIQNVLDDLQIEANTILEKIRPGLQLSFVIEKTKGDGQIDDDLEIDYFINGQPIDYQLLSGAQKIDVMFGLKLGLSSLQKKKLGSNIKMLLLDEVDPALDPLGVDYFAEIIKILQKDFTILVITHNPRLQDKFKTKIIVEQDRNMVSKAKVVGV